MIVNALKREYTALGTRRKGSILVLVLWTLGLLSVFAVYLGDGVRQRLEFLSRIETRNTLQWIAEAGVKRAIAAIGSIDKKSVFIDLHQPWSADAGSFSEVPVCGGTFTVGYAYESKEYAQVQSGPEEFKMMYGAADAESRLNVNTADQDELSRIIQRAAGVDLDTADTIASCIVDWRDPDSASLPRGAEDEYYRSLHNGYVCKNFPFQTIDELCYVKGVTPEIFSRIQPYLTVYGSGKININTAYATTLSALGLSDEVIAKILRFRCGEDGVEATADDRACTAAGSIVAQVSRVAAFSPAEAAQLSNLAGAGRFSTFSSVFIISSAAKLDKKPGKCRVECVIEKDMREKSTRAGIILSWRMQYGV